MAFPGEYRDAVPSQRPCRMAVLRMAGLRPTRQCVALAELLFTGAHQHVSAEELQRVIDIPSSAITIEGLPKPPEGTRIAHVDVVVRVTKAMWRKIPVQPNEKGHWPRRSLVSYPNVRPRPKLRQPRTTSNASVYV